MSVNILTREDLAIFKEEFLSEMKTLFNQKYSTPKKWLKTDEVRKLLQVSAGTLQSLRISGTLTYTKLGGILYYDYEHIEKMMQENLKVARKT